MVSGSKTTMSAHMPGLMTPRSASRRRAAGSALNLRMASGSVSAPSSRTYLRRMRGKGSVRARMRMFQAEQTVRRGALRNRCRC